MIENEAVLSCVPGAASAQRRRVRGGVRRGRQELLGPSRNDGKVEEVTSGRSRGAGIRVVVGETTGFADTADLSERGLLAVADAASAVARYRRCDPHGLPRDGADGRAGRPGAARVGAEGHQGGVAGAGRRRRSWRRRCDLSGEGELRRQPATEIGSPTGTERPSTTRSAPASACLRGHRRHRHADRLRGRRRAPIGFEFFDGIDVEELARRGRPAGAVQADGPSGAVRDCPS